ncbi:vitamin B12 dependent-methionine synthase activation domain-containing protein [Chloroflexota bacterium]
MLGIKERKERIGIRIDKEDVYRHLGYPAGQKMPARMSSLLNEYLENVNNLVDASYAYVIKDIEFVHGSFVIVENSVIFESQIIAKLLGQCEMVAVFALTIGDQLEKTVYKLADDGLVLQATVLDAIGSVAVESVADSMHSMISALAEAQGLCTSRRFSPGYCDWEIDQQKRVFQSMNGEAVDVNLTEGYLMVPQKSISGIIGIGTRERDVQNYNPCNACKEKDCPGRRESSNI